MPSPNKKPEDKKRKVFPKDRGMQELNAIKNFPAVYKKAIETVLRAHLRQTGILLDAHHITVRAIHAAIPADIRPTRLAVRSFHIENTALLDKILAHMEQKLSARSGRSHD